MENPITTGHSPGASEVVPQNSVESGKLPNDAEHFRTIPQPSESFRSVPNGSAPFGMVPNTSEGFRYERKQSHTITVRDAARMFEDAGVARTERSIVNWCQRDATGYSRLDGDFDPNERRYYITEESIQRAISEEKAKMFRNVPNGAESLLEHSEPNTKNKPSSGNVEHASSDDVERLRNEIFNLQILNAAKDIAIKQLGQQNEKWVQQLRNDSKRIGELETHLLQLEEPAERRVRVRPSLPKHSEGEERFDI